jgi:hypothetical protein
MTPSRNTYHDTQGKSMQDDDPRRRFAFGRIEGRAGELYAWRLLIPADGGGWVDGPIQDESAHEISGHALDKFPANVVLTHQSDRWTFRSS